MWREVARKRRKMAAERSVADAGFPGDGGRVEMMSLPERPPAMGAQRTTSK